MKAIIFGATGRVGRRLVKGALDRDHEVTILIREQARLPLPEERCRQVRVVIGDIRDLDVVQTVMSGQEVAICAIGPWDPSEPDNLMETALSNITSAMLDHGVGRLLVVGAAGLLPHPQKKGKLIGEIKLPELLRPAFEDHLAGYRVLTELAVDGNSLDWIVVCPTAMLEGEPTGRYTTAVDTLPKGASGTISVGDVAIFLLSEVSDPSHHNCRVGISS
jgi:putative NADH-flavin reductase